MEDEFKVYKLWRKDVRNEVGIRGEGNKGRNRNKGSKEEVRERKVGIKLYGRKWELEKKLWRKVWNEVYRNVWRKLLHGNKKINSNEILAKNTNDQEKLSRIE